MILFLLFFLLFGLEIISSLIFIFFFLISEFTSIDEKFKFEMPKFIHDQSAPAPDNDYF